MILENIIDFNFFFVVDLFFDLNFKIIDENIVYMLWERLVDLIVGYRIIVDFIIGEF